MFLIVTKHLSEAIEGREAYSGSQVEGLSVKSGKTLMEEHKVTQHLQSGNWDINAGVQHFLFSQSRIPTHRMVLPILNGSFWLN